MSASRFPDPPTDECLVRMGTLDPFFHRGRVRFRENGQWSLDYGPVRIRTFEWHVVAINVRAMEMRFRVCGQCVRVRWTRAKEFSHALKRMRGAPRDDARRLVSATI